MKVIELKQKYDEFIASHSKEEADMFPFGDYVEIQDYIPVSSKLDVAQKAVAELYEEKDGIRSYDINAFHIIEELTIVSLYTDIEYTEEETFIAYDILKQIGFFEYLTINGYEDVFRFKSIYSDTFLQIVEEYNSLPSVINRGLLRLENRIVNAIDNFAEKANMSPESIQQLQESLKSINSTMSRVKNVKSADVVEALKDDNN